MITNVILILWNSSINKKLILRDLRVRHHIPCFCSISPTKIIPNSHHSTVLHLWMSPVFRSWTNQPFKWFGSIAMTHLLSQRHLLAILISHLKYLHLKKNIMSNISFQRFMFQISKHYLCICNCRLKHSRSLWAALNVCKYIYMPLQMQLLCFLCVAVVDTDLICLVTAQIKNLTQKMMHLF